MHGVVRSRQLQSWGAYCALFSPEGFHPCSGLRGEDLNKKPSVPQRGLHTPASCYKNIETLKMFGNILKVAVEIAGLS